MQRSPGPRRTPGALETPNPAIANHQWRNMRVSGTPYPRPCRTASEKSHAARDISDSKALQGQWAGGFGLSASSRQVRGMWAGARTRPAGFCVWRIRDERNELSTCMFHGSRSRRAHEFQGAPHAGEVNAMPRPPIAYSGPCGSLYRPVPPPSSPARRNSAGLTWKRPFRKQWTQRPDGAVLPSLFSHSQTGVISLSRHAMP